MATLKTMQQAGGIFGCVAAAADLLRALGEEIPRALEECLDAWSIFFTISRRFLKGFVVDVVANFFIRFFGDKLVQSSLLVPFSAFGLFTPSLDKFSPILPK